MQRNARVYYTLLAGTLVLGGAGLATSAVAGTGAPKSIQERPAVVQVSTTAVDDADKDHEISHLGGYIIDTVRYTGLEPGKTYVVQGELMNKVTGKSAGSRAAATFTPVLRDGHVTVQLHRAGHARRNDAGGL